MKNLEEGLETVKSDCCKTVENGLRAEHDGMLAGLEEITRSCEKRKADLDEVGKTLHNCHERAEGLQ